MKLKNNYENLSLSLVQASACGSIEKHLSIFIILKSTRYSTIKKFPMLYMIIEKFHAGKVKSLYKRFEEKGRMMPDGVTYINSWITEDVTTCFQVMEADTFEKLNEWISNWNDLADFEIIPVLISPQAKEKVFAGEY